jgi:hypothetical protein
MKSPNPALLGGYLRLKRRNPVPSKGTSSRSENEPVHRLALLLAAFVVFLFYGNIAPALVIALGVVFVVSGARPKSDTRPTTEGDPE